MIIQKESISVVDDPCERPVIIRRNCSTNANSHVRLWHFQELSASPALNQWT